MGLHCEIKMRRGRKHKEKWLPDDLGSVSFAETGWKSVGCISHLLSHKRMALTATADVRQNTRQASGHVWDSEEA